VLGALCCGGRWVWGALCWGWAGPGRSGCCSGRLPCSNQAAAPGRPSTPPYQPSARPPPAAHPSSQVLQVNGAPVHSLAHLAQAITSASPGSSASASPGSSSSSSPGSPGYVRLDLEWSKVVVLDAASAAAATPRILRQNNIPAPASEGLLEQVGARLACWAAGRLGDGLAGQPGPLGARLEAAARSCAGCAGPRLCARPPPAARQAAPHLSPTWQPRARLRAAGAAAAPAPLPQQQQQQRRRGRAAAGDGGGQQQAVSCLRGASRWRRARRSPVAGTVHITSAGAWVHVVHARCRS
jgi:hypothetical protein